MNIKRRKPITAISLLLVFSIAQVYVQVGLAGSMTFSKAVTNLIPNQLSGKLATTKNKTILVNGNSAKTDATVLSGALIDTPSGVGATIDLGTLGSLDMAPNSSVRLEFSDGSIKVTLIKGCIILKTNPNTAGSIVTDKGEATTIDPASGGSKDVCYTPGAAAAVVGAGAAAAAGAGAAGAGAAAAGIGAVAAGGVAAGGISTTTGVLIGAAAIAAATTAAIFVPCRRGPNPSPGDPRGRNDECRRGL
jgi:hypothetical protein